VRTLSKFVRSGVLRRSRLVNLKAIEAEVVRSAVSTPVAVPAAEEGGDVVNELVVGDIRLSGPASLPTPGHEQRSSQ
jgi:hypothetical protein